MGNLNYKFIAIVAAVLLLLSGMIYFGYGAMKSYGKKSTPVSIEQVVPKELPKTVEQLKPVEAPKVAEGEKTTVDVVIDVVADSAKAVGNAITDAAVATYNYIKGNAKCTTDDERRKDPECAWAKPESGNTQAP